MKKQLQHIVSLLAITFFLFIAVGSDDDDDKKEETTEISESDKIQSDESLTQQQKDSLLKIERVKEIEYRESQTISARSLVAEYENNEVGADNNFKDKTFYVEGTIADIGKGIMDEIYITMKASSNSFRNVQCYIDDAELVAKLKKGQHLTVYGTCNGLMMNVMMKNCTVVENLSTLKKKK